MKFLKNKAGFSLLEILLVVSIIGILAAIIMPGRAQLAQPGGTAQTGQPNFFYNDTNYVFYTLTTNQTKTITPGATNSNYIKTIRQGQGVGLFLTVWATNSSVTTVSTNYTIAGDVCGDGSTWTTGSSNGFYSFTWTVGCPGGGTFTNTFFTNIPAASLSNLRKIQITKASTTLSNSVAAALGFSQSTQ